MFAVQGWGEYYSGTRLAQNDKHEYTKSIVLEYYSSTDFPVLVLVCSVLAPALLLWFLILLSCWNLFLAHFWLLIRFLTFLFLEFDGLVQNCFNPSALVMESLQSCTLPSQSMFSAQFLFLVFIVFESETFKVPQSQLLSISLFPLV